MAGVASAVAATVAETVATNYRPVSRGSCRVVDHQRRHRPDTMDTRNQHLATGQRSIDQHRMEAGSFGARMR
uniref:Putative secreted protein n=1 Tax=Anopheles triannulatus TaxID=58253 RepID=A0A2M4B6L4_9DIPT